MLSTPAARCAGYRLPRRDGRRRAVALTRTEYAILKRAAEPRPGPGPLLRSRISADTPDCTKRSLRQHISNLRRKLASHIGRDCIEAVWGIGFRLKL
ncbi:MAG: helix-turn-helix domain-containing protein [Oscillospiraceae bacterium]